MLTDTTTIEITKAEQIGPYILCLRFSDGVSKNINFEPFLSGSHNPLIRKYLEPSEFSKFTVDNGDLVWNDYDLCFPIADLYENRI